MNERSLRYDGQVAIVTGAGNGIGKQYALYFASRGAKVVVNDLGGNIKGGKGRDAGVADVVVEQIRSQGGTAVANYDPVQHGASIIDTAIQHFGRVDVLINNAGILRDTTLRKMKDEDWDILMDVHVYGTMRTTRAAWPYFQRQGYGRIVNTSSSSGLFGNFGQSNYAAAKMAILGFSMAVAKEGANINVHCNVLAPSAASRLTATVWTPEMMEAMGPERVVPIVGALTHSSCQQNGGIFLAGAGHFSKLRWQRSLGVAFKDSELMVSEVIRQHNKIQEWGSDHTPSSGVNPAKWLHDANHVPVPDMKSLQDQVALIRVTPGVDTRCCSYAMYLSQLGAKVIVCGPNADALVKAIRGTGGQAFADLNPEDDAATTIQDAVKQHGRIDILANILTTDPFEDRSLGDITEKGWAERFQDRLRGMFLLTREIWPVFVKQKYGRVINIAGAEGIYGSSGRTLSSAAACGMFGFTKTVAREGQKYNIVVNAVAARTDPSLSDTINAKDIIVALLSSRQAPATGQIYEASSCWVGTLRWQRSGGVDFEDEDGVPSADAVFKNLPRICDFDDGRADHPATPAEGSGHIHTKGTDGAKRIAQIQAGNTSKKWLSKISAALQQGGKPSTFHYTDRDILLYNIGVGAKAGDVALVFEQHEGFSALPTFGVVPSYFAPPPYSLEKLVPNYSLNRVLHSDQALDIKKWPIPSSGTLTSATKLLEVLDKGSATIVRSETTSRDQNGDVIFRSERAIFIRGSGKFGGKAKSDVPTISDKTPSRPPDKVVEEKTSEDLAAIYRLLGDRNPLHIDPGFSATVGFAKPILHGLATFGIAGKHIFLAYGPLQAIRVRFSGIVIPGETLVTSMWLEEREVVFVVKVKETGKHCITHARAQLWQSTSKL